ncbi:MAG: ATP-binding cassette domain-containing protein, partial [SAR324 cluster bacterium]|nr:ATP-binding cassette domain-containing protein [SAR324 cluster bacterium]
MTEPIVQVKNLSMHFGQDSGFLKGPQRVVKAVDNVSLEVYEGETLGLVGESGCGKSTITRAILGLDPIIDGKIILEGDEITAYNVTNNIRKKLQ